MYIPPITCDRYERTDRVDSEFPYSVSSAPFNASNGGPQTGNDAPDDDLRRTSNPAILQDMIPYPSPHQNKPTSPLSASSPLTAFRLNPNAVAFDFDVCDILSRYNEVYN